MRAVEPRTFLDRPRQLCHVAGNDSVHAGLAHGFVAKLIAVGRAASPENRSGRKSSFPKVFGKRLGGGEMDADGAVAVAFLVDGEGGLVAVLMKVPHAQPAGGGKPYAGVEVGFEDGTVAEVEYVVAGGKTHQLTGAGGGQRPRALQRIGRLAGERAYRRDVLSFVDFLGLTWPQEAFRLLLASVADVQRWRDTMMAATKAPKTLNRRISSLSSFYKYLAGAAAELRLPVNVPNPAHAQFIARESSDPLEGTRRSPLPALVS